MGNDENTIINKGEINKGNVTNRKGIKWII